jgi:hypothetical protein
MVDSESVGTRGIILLSSTDERNVSENDSRIDLSVSHPRTWTIMRAGSVDRHFSAESRSKHVVSSPDTRLNDQNMETIL